MSNQFLGNDLKKQTNPTTTKKQLIKDFKIIKYIGGSNS